MPKIWKEMRIHLKGSSHVRNLPVFGKTLGFPPVSTSFHQFPRPQPPGHRLIWRHHGRRRKGGCHKFRGHGEGSSRLDPVVWCRFCLVGCVVSFLCVGLLWLRKLSICLGKLRWVAHGFASWKSGWSLRCLPPSTLIPGSPGSLPWPLS